MSSSEIVDTLSSNNRASSPCPINLAVLMMVAKHRQLVDFLQTELAIPAESISMALRQTTEAPSLLPMVLWQYGLVTLRQLEQIFDWLEDRPLNSLS